MRFGIFDHIDAAGVPLASNSKNVCASPKPTTGWAFTPTR